MYCKTCQNTIIYNNDLHLLTCHKHTTTCKVCNKVIPKSNLEEHTNGHVLINCKCGKTIEQQYLTDHLNDDIHKEEQCKYCDWILPNYELKDHVIECGAKTTKCTQCNNWVQNSMIVIGLQDGTKSQNVCLQCRTGLKKYSAVFRQNMQKEMNKKFKKNENTCPFCFVNNDNNELLQEHIFMNHNDDTFF